MLHPKLCTLQILVTTYSHSRVSPHSNKHCKSHATPAVTDCNEHTTNPCFFFFPWEFNVVLPEGSEHQFVRINSIWERECGAQVPPELRHLLDPCQDLGIHGFLVNLALLCQLVFLQNTKNNSKILGATAESLRQEKIQGKPWDLGFFRSFPHLFLIMGTWWSTEAHLGVNTVTAFLDQKRHLTGIITPSPLRKIPKFKRGG